MRSRLLTILGIAVAAFLALVVLAALMQRRMIYIPLTRQVSPVAAVLPGAEEVEFVTTDGLTLHGWFLPAAPTSDRVTVLVFNGNAGNRSFRAPLAAALARHGLGVMLFDYRGYAENPGHPSETGLVADARGVLAYLKSRPDVDPDRIAYFGESLGTGVAVALAADEPPFALILRSPFTSLTDVGRTHYPFLPVGLMLRDRYPSIDRIARLESPLLVIAGDSDRIVPTKLSLRLYEAAPPGRKQLVVIEGAGHNDLDLLAGETMIEAVVSFLRD